MANQLREEELVSAAYEIAEKMYNIYWRELNSLRVDKDDYLQDAVIYILDLYKKDYMKIDDDKRPHGMIFTMLKRFTKNYFQKSARVNKRNQLTLNRPMGEDETELLDKLPSNLGGDPEEIAIDQETYEEGEQLLYEIIEEFDVVPYRTTKHSYKGNHPILGKNLKLSEYNIGRLLLMGLDEYEILKVYNVYQKNIGASSTATYVHRKVKNVIDKLADIIKQGYSEEEIESIRAYLAKK